MRPATGRESAASGVMASEDAIMAVTSPGAGRSISGEITYETKISTLCASRHGRAYLWRCVPGSEPRSTRREDQVDPFVDPLPDRLREVGALVCDDLVLGDRVHALLLVQNIAQSGERAIRSRILCGRVGHAQQADLDYWTEISASRSLWRARTNSQGMLARTEGENTCLSPSDATASQL
mgnify:CR=1 FL=1|jgi:hypothetical protein